MCAECVFLKEDSERDGLDTPEFTNLLDQSCCGGDCCKPN